MSSPFSRVPQSKWIASNELAFAILDKEPVTPGHSLVITRREARSFFDATGAEKAAVFDLAEVVCQMIGADDPTVTGFNIGTNAGQSAGQTIFHWHVHVIPRREGDTLMKHGGGMRMVTGSLPNQWRW